MTFQEMAALHHACFTTPRPWSAQELADIVRNPHSFALSVPQGFVVGRVVAGEAELLTLAVDPAARRQGIGRNLLTQFLDSARQRGATLVYLEVAVDNTAAIALYQAAGFAKAGLRLAYYTTKSGTRLDGVVMTCPVLPQSG